MFNFHSSFSYNESHLARYYLLLIRFSSLVLSVLIQENGCESGKNASENLTYTCSQVGQKT